MKNLDDLTMREVIDLQKATGLKLDQLQTDPAVFSVGTAWIIQRRVDPSFTYDQALDLRAVDIARILEADDPKDE